MKQLLITIAALVLVGCGPSAPDISIHEAVNWCNIEAVRQHIAAGTDVNAKDNRGSAPLHIAARDGHKRIAELLIANGADVNAKSEFGTTPLHSAGTKEVAELFIAKGADVNAMSNKDETPLDSAIEIGYTWTADVLRKHGGKHGTIHGAAYGGDIEAVKEFLAAGTDVNAKSNYGTPLDVAIEENHTEIADLLRKHGGKTGAELKAEGKSNIY